MKVLVISHQSSVICPLSSVVKSSSRQSVLDQHFFQFVDFQGFGNDKHLIVFNLVGQGAEINRKTVIEYDSGHSQADEYRTLANKIENNQMFIVPKPLEIDELEKMLIEHGLAT